LRTGNCDANSAGEPNSSSIALPVFLAYRRSSVIAPAISGSVWPRMRSNSTSSRSYRAVFFAASSSLISQFSRNTEATWAA